MAIEKSSLKNLQLDGYALASMQSLVFDPAIMQWVNPPKPKAYKKGAKGLQKKEVWKLVPEVYVPEAGRDKQIRLRTQKARGVVAGRTMNSIGAIPRWLDTAKILTVLPQGYPDIAGLENRFPLFARPCPRRPRHGFVESRVVKTKEELLAVVAETMAADRLGEVMVMKPLTGRASAVATNSGVVWGLGNAGVTAGKGTQIMLPVPPKPKDCTITDHLKHSLTQFAGEMHGSVFMEVVEEEGEPKLVQLRDGPADVAIGGNYVPHADYEVTNVIIPTFEEIENLLLWEKRVAGAPEGTAILLKHSSLTSHCAVHGLANKFAVITTGPFCDRPEDLQPGCILQPEASQPAPLTTADYKKIAKLMSKAVPGHRKARAAFAVSVLHAMSVWDNSPHLLWMRAAGVVTMAKLIVAACAGEARHFYRCGPGRYSVDARASVEWKKITGRDLSRSGNNCPERFVVLQSVYRFAPKRLAVIAEQCVQDFRGKWNGQRVDRRTGRMQGSCGYGGPKWKASSKAALKLCTAILAFRRDPCERTWKEVAMGYNMAVCLAHNGGRVLNKWASAQEIDACAHFPQFGLLSPHAMYICTGVKSDEAGLQAKKKKQPACGLQDCTSCPMVRVYA